MNIPCIKCKGVDLSCGRAFCPIYAKSEAMFRVKDSLPKQDFFGSSPAPFVGHNFYPDLYVGLLSLSEHRDDAWVYDAPRHWAKNNFQIPQIISYRSALINSRFRANVKDQNKLLDIGREIGMASKPVDVEISLKDKPYFKLNTDAYAAPMGPNAKLKSAKITENTKIDAKVDKVSSDKYLKAGDALVYLYKKGFDENFLTKILSVGALGLKRGRKLVPTRWSITATDDTLAKNLLSGIKQFPEYGCCSYFGGYMGNYFLMLFFPDVWSYELFETYMPKASWNISGSIGFTTDYEPYDGRKNYAENCGGGYYAARLPILEKLSGIKRQSSVLALRFITGDYAVPLGVWVVRESVRAALAAKPLEFSSKELMLNYAKILIKKKFNFDIDLILKNSIMLKGMKQQSKLANFL